MELQTTPFIATAMRCTRKQLDEIATTLIEKGCLIDYTYIGKFGEQQYLINNFKNIQKNISNGHIDFISHIQPEKVYHQWDAELFIKNLGGEEIEAPPTYDRAAIATQMLRTVIANSKTDDIDLIVNDAVALTDALIERLNQKPQ